MNIPQIKEKYTCFDILGKPVRRGGKSFMYRCPWRQDRHPSLAVSENGKGWKDWATGESGGIIELIAKIIDSENFGDICRWAASFFLSPVKNLPKEFDEGKKKVKDEYSLLPLTSASLFTYLDSRGIPRDVASQFLQEIHWPNPTNPDRYLFGLGYPTDSGGVAMRNLRFKRFFGAGGITTHFLSETRSTVVFEGFFDMLSWVTLTEKRQKSNFIVLNSVANVAMAIVRIHEGFPSKTIYLALDNDKAGDLATQQLLAAFPAAQDVRPAYRDFKDLNEYLLSKRKR